MSDKVWILGCSMENEELLFLHLKISSIMGNRDWYMKASFDKANILLVRR